MVDLTSLSPFLAVADERSFTRAAKHLGVSPSAVSHTMRTLARIGYGEARRFNETMKHSFSLTIYLLCGYM